MNIAYNMDCMKAMQQIPDHFFDLAVVDPPYFSGPERRGYYGKASGGVGRRKDYTVSPKWEIPGQDCFQELQRVSKKFIVWGCNYFSFRFPPGRIVWDKCNVGSSFSDCEIAATNCHDSVRLFRYMWNGMMQGKSVGDGSIMQGDKRKNEVRIYPTQKPVALYSWIYNRYANLGDKVLDTHLGSGSSRIAAYDAGLDFVGFEINPHYFKAQEERFLEHTAQMSLFLSENELESGRQTMFDLMGGWPITNEEVIKLANRRTEMLDLTNGGRCIGGLDAVAFFEALPDSIPDAVKTEQFCNEYEWALNRLRAEVQKSVPIAPKAHKGNFTNYTCGQCGYGVDVNNKFCPQCGQAVDWRDL